MLKRPLLAKFYGRNLLLGGSSEGARVLHHFKLLSLINNNSFRHFSIGSRNLQQENSSSQKPSIEKTLEQDFPSLKKSSSNAASTQAGKPKTVSSFFKSPFIKTQDERNQYLGTFREIISVSLKEIPNSVVAIATILFLPLAFGTTSFYFSSLPASVLLEYQLNYASMLLILFGSTHLGLEFANFVNKEKFRSFLEAQKSVSPFTPSKQQENTVPVDVEKELEARKTSHSVVRGVLCSLPPMVGFLCLSLPVLQSTLLLSLTFIVLSYYDAYLTARGLAPQWFTSLKIPFTIIIVATLIVSFFFYIVYGAMQQFEKSTEQELAQFEKKSRARSREGIDFLAVAEAKKNRLKTLSTQSPDKPESE
ncbi:hypothetical protein C9374_000609 [Naegleria lovaniensis]|uniref:Uncharacterized protein n=1 Tax=Naegleria lovaniensis TaxID=51637 RepID=A0AA88GT79_NAELO|nr:uncharacterized protein C9374_000609 [Naegleria lovaniensis]KAG2388445.1 hypothetical protein C9374_000609 [Naegleria lovaniensis]